MREKLSDVLIDFAETTTAHAPPKIRTHKHILSKLFWGFLFLTGIGTFIYFTQGLIGDYIKYETTTDIELKFSVLEFPAVTFCNQNQFRKDKIQPELRALLDDFLESKRADMFGGKDKYSAFKSREANEQPSGPGRNSGEGDSSNDVGGNNDPPFTTANLTGNDDSNSDTNPAPASGTIMAPTNSDGDEGSNNDTNPAPASGTTMAPANSDGQSGASSNGSGNATTAPPPPPSGKRRRRRKRSIQHNLNEEELKIIEDMHMFYNEPEEEIFANMSWFDNHGEPSSEKSILLNLTQYISQYSDKQLGAAGHNIGEMLQECVFLGKTCGPEDFYHFYDNKYGNCYTFNSGMDGTVARITNPGTSFGLSMTMFVNQEQYIPVLTQEAGLRVLLHRQGQVPIMEEDGFDVNPGTKSGIAVRYVEISRLDGKYSNCTVQGSRTAESGNHDYYPGNYTQKACLKTCLQKGVMKQCGCANPLYRKPENSTICGPVDNACVEQTEFDLLDNNICSNQCPTPCWESQYQYVISTSQWPSNNYMPYLKESLDERGDIMKGVMKSDARTGLSQQFLKMVVYYDNLNYYKYKERPTMTFKDLVGALGGHLGLWIGMSVISFVEVFELVLAMFKWCCKSGRNNKTSSLTDLGDQDRCKTECPTPVLSMKDTWVKHS